MALLSFAGTLLHVKQTGHLIGQGENLGVLRYAVNIIQAQGTPVTRKMFATWLAVLKT